MHITMQDMTRALSALGALFAIPFSAASAQVPDAPLDLFPTVPVLSYNGSGAYAHDAGSDLFSVNASPLSIDLDNGDGTSSTFTVTSINSLAVLQSKLYVDSNGVLSGGVTGDPDLGDHDLRIQGAVVIDLDGDFIPDPAFDGVLVTGEVLGFGFTNGVSVDKFEVVYEVTGGLLTTSNGPSGQPPLKLGDSIGLVLDSEIGSTFDGSFDVTFNGPAKGRVGKVVTMSGSTPFDCYAVNKVIIRNLHGEKHDKLRLTKGALTCPADIDITQVPVEVKVDSKVYSLMGFSRVGDADKYVYRSAHGERPFVRAMINCEKGTWAFGATRDDVGDIDISDGAVDVRLTVGDFQAEDLGLPVSPLGPFGKVHVYAAHPRERCEDQRPDKPHSCLALLKLRHTSGRILTWSKAHGDLKHWTMATDDDSGDMAMLDTSCAQCMRCGDRHGAFTVARIESTPGCRMSQACQMSDVSCNILSEDEEEADDEIR